MLRSKLLFILLSFFHCNIFSETIGGAGGNGCRDIFVGSKLYYANQAVQRHANDRDIHSQFTDVFAERNQVKNWSKPPAGVPNRIMNPFPENVHLINHQLPRPANATTVKLGEAGGTVLMARAYYSYAGWRFGTNVTLSARALANNLLNMKEPGSKNWLVGEDATAAILYLHGGGTRSTGGHTAEGLVNHFRDFNIDVVALDLPWHAEGHREILPSLETEIKALSAFAQKYIPPNVPLFVWGHSWGAVWAEALMRMTDRPPSAFSFHHSLTGVMIMAPAVDAAPGQSMSTKLREYQRRIKDSRKNQSHLFAPREGDLRQQMVEQGKINPISSLITTLFILGLDQQLPKHKGEKYVEAVVGVSKGDSQAYRGFEDLFDVYNHLVNVDFHLLDRLPIKDGDPSKYVLVGHLLRDYVFPGTQIPIDIKIASDFIARKIGVKKLKRQGTDLPYSNYISTVQEYANNLAFREYVDSHSYFITRKTRVGELLSKRAKIEQDVYAAFGHYSYVPRRLQYALEQLVSSKNEQEYMETMEEIGKLSQPDFVQKISNNPVMTQELRTLYDEIISWTKSDELYVEIDQAQFVRQWAKRVLNNKKLKRFLNQKAITIGRRPLLARRIVESPDLETATALVKAEQLPEKVEKLILAKLTEKFIMEDIINGLYVPTFEVIAERSMFNIADKERIETRISGIRSNVEQRRILQADIKEYFSQLKLLIEVNMDLIKEVHHYIRIIKVAFQESNREAPDSLREMIDASKEELDRLVDASDKLNEATENALPLPDPLKDGEATSFNVFSEVINKHAEAINASVRQYENYALRRRHLRRDLIVAIEKGEMGKQFKEAVLQIYGTDSGGHRPREGSNTVYLRLEDNMKAMAKLESNLYDKRSSLHELNVDYQQLFTNLLQLIRLHDNNEDIAEIPNVYIYYNDTIKQLLTRPKTSDHLSAQEQREEHLGYVKKNERKFQQVNQEWKKEMSSDLSPLLPTADAVEF